MIKKIINCLVYAWALGSLTFVITEFSFNLFGFYLLNGVSRANLFVMLILIGCAGFGYITSYYIIKYIITKWKK